MFFDQMNGPMANPAGLTSPGLNQSSLAALMAMGGGGMGGGMGGPPGGPQLNPLQPRTAGMNMPGAAPPGPQQSNILQMLMQNPALLKQLLGSMGGMGGGGMPSLSAMGAGLGANNAAGMAAGMPSTGY